MDGLTVGPLLGPTSANFFLVPTVWMSNVVYEFSCLHDADARYIGMASGPLIAIAQEHLNSNFNKTAITQHISSCQ